jgi:hypothetical protein
VTDTAKCATPRRAANTMENIETPRVTRPVAGHRELGVPLILNRMIGSPTANAPRPAALAYDTADGRSPGSRVVVFRRLPGPRESSGHLTEFSPLTVAGAAAELGASAPSLHSHFDPYSGTVAPTLRGNKILVKLRGAKLCFSGQSERLVTFVIPRITTICQRLSGSNEMRCGGQ